MDSKGNFSGTLTLAEGTNQLQAASRNRAGIGPLSSKVTVTLDTSIPKSPSGVSAQAKSGGVIQLTWQAITGTSVKGYNIYRALTAFNTKTEATKINASLITGTSYNDIPASDGIYYYRITAVSQANNESELSNSVSAESDSTLPRAVSIQYTLAGQSNPITGKTAAGIINLMLTVSEPLQAVPFLSLTPNGGLPISIELTKISDLTYSGIFAISNTTPTGRAYAVFSARDKVGNRGTEIEAGATLDIDTSGPEVTSITVNPNQPIKNDANNPVSITVTISLSEAVKSGTTPTLAYLLSGTGRSETAISTLANIGIGSQLAKTWQGTFTLPSDAGLSGPENLKFSFSAVDDLNNTSTKISCANQFQVYQGDLPPLAIPTGLIGKSLPGGYIKLTWNSVEGAAGYQLYRQAPGESGLTAYMLPLEVLEYTEKPSVDGTYTYAAASVRQVNGQESLSAQSTPVQVVSDSVPPNAPQNLSLELLGSGIKATWQAPAYTEPVTYSLYRDNAAEITSIEGLTPIITGIQQTTTTDSHPSPSAHAYVVAAVDAAGNISALSNSFYLNFQLLPVSSLNVTQSDNDLPVISWTSANQNAAGYDTYLGQDSQLTRLNTALITSLSYTDTGYTGQDRRYTVVTVDNYGEESLGRSINLPVLQATLQTGAQVKRGIMNRLQYTVGNGSTYRVEHIQLKVTLANYNHTSAEFSLEAGETKTISVVVGGYADLPDIANLATTLEITPNTGEKVDIVHHSTIEIGNDLLALSLTNEEFVRGTNGSAQFTLQNTSSEEIEIITATGSGSAASNEVKLYLLDSDGNVLAVASLKQALGQNVVTLSNGNTVARIPAGGSFTSDAIQISIPASAPDQVKLQLEISKLYYHQGQSDQVSISGLNTSRQVSLANTSYYGEVTNISPQTSRGNKSIVISGRAVYRQTGEALPKVSLKLVITVNGFERSYSVFTGNSGLFSYTFTPLNGESGSYNVCAIHPDLLDRPMQGQFVIQGVTVDPKLINLTIPRNYEQAITIKVTSGAGTQLNNLKLVCDAQDQADSIFPVGVHVTLGSPVGTLGDKQLANLSLTVWADNNAAQTGSLVLKVISDETGADNWARITIKTYFTEAKPVLNFSPSYVETGVAPGEMVSETVTLENKGFADMKDVTLTILNSDGSATPTWVMLNAAASQGALAVGEKRDIGLSFAPDASVTEGIYQFKLRITSSNYQTTDINLYISVTQSGTGGALFKVEDIYTATLDSNGNPIQGVAGAEIKLQNELVPTVEFIKTTDSLGETLITSVPAGSYKYRVRAANHQEYIGRVRIRPGVTASESVFLEYNLVSVEWEVVPTTIQDKYEIVLSATYKTDVPAPVLVASPTSITLPEMQPGDIFNTEVKFINYGLVRLDNAVYRTPSNDQYFKYEILTQPPDSIGAKEVVTLPIRVTCLSSLNPATGGGGGGCSGYQNCGSGGGSATCANGKETDVSAIYCMLTYATGSCGGGGGGDSGEGVSYISGPIHDGNSSGGKGVSPTPSGGGGCKIPPNPCPPGACCPSFGSGGGGGAGGAGGAGSMGGIGGGSGAGGVNLISGQYQDSATDMPVKVQGGNVNVARQYYDNQWHITDNYNGLQFGSASGTASGTPSYIQKDGVSYQPDSDQGSVYRFKTDRYITKTDNGWRWENTHGDWSNYDTTGKLLTYGTKKGGEISLIYSTGDRLIGVTDHTGRQVVWYKYNADNQIGSVIDIANRQVQYHYSAGRLSRVVDVLGNETVYSYDANGRLISKQDVAGRIISVSYNSNGYVSGVTDAAGVTKAFDYNYDTGKQQYYASMTYGSGKVEEMWFNTDGDHVKTDVNGVTYKTTAKSNREDAITDVAGNITDRKYDEWGNITQDTYPDGSSVTYEYQPNSTNITQKVDERGTITNYEYDNSGNIIRVVEAAGTPMQRVTEYTYDTYGNQTSIKTVGNENTAEAVTTMNYDDNGNMISITDPEGNTTRFTYDVLGNMLTKTDAAGKLWQYAYDAAGHLTSSIDPLGNTAHMYYDVVGNMIKAVDSEGKETVNEYSPTNKLVKTTDALGNSVLYSYDTEGQLVERVDQEGKRIAYVYDLDGRLSKTIDGNGNTINNTYGNVPAGGGSCSACSGGASGNPIQVTYPTFSKTFTYDKRGRKVEEDEILTSGTTYTMQYAYDATGNLTQTTDKKGRITQNAYDMFNRLANVTDTANNITSYTYDARNNLIALKDAKGNVSKFEYDRNNHLVKEIRPMGQATNYVYNATGLLLRKIDAKGQTIEYGYDDAGRLTDTSYYSTTTSNPVKMVVFTYNKVGKLTGYDDGITSGRYIYDDLYCKISETVHYGSFSLSYSYTYYKNGRKKTFTGPYGITYTYTYDNNNQLSNVFISSQGYITYNSYTWNKPNSITLPGGSIVEYSYDPLMRLKSIIAKDPAQAVLMNYGYTYDLMSNITAKNTQDGNYAYSYDPLYRLTGANNPGFGNEAYTYDITGNRLSTSDTTGSWGYNANNQLTSYPSATFAYDANGNMTQQTVNGVTRNYIYDIETRLIRIENADGSVVAEYYYDPFGRRLWKDVGGTRTNFFYADEGLVGEYDANGNELRTYGYKPDSTWTTDPLFQEENGKYYFYHNDHLGTPMLLTDSSGAVVWIAKYYTFGKVNNGTGSIRQPLRFPGQYEDDESELYYNRFRYYNPLLGRYISEDLNKLAIYIAVEYGDKSGLNYYHPMHYNVNAGRFIGKNLVNSLPIQLLRQIRPKSCVNTNNLPVQDLYFYTRNNPVNSIDPWGKDIVPPNPDPGPSPINAGVICANMVAKGSSASCESCCSSTVKRNSDQQYEEDVEDCTTLCDLKKDNPQCPITPK